MKTLHLFNQHVDDEILNMIGKSCMKLQTIDFDSTEACFSIEGIVNLLNKCRSLKSLKFMPIEDSSTFRFKVGDMTKICEAGTALSELLGYDLEYHRSINSNDEELNDIHRAEFEAIIREAQEASGDKLRVAYY